MITIHSDGAYTTRNKRAVFSWGYIIHRGKDALFSAGNCMTTVAGYEWLHAGSGYAEYLGIYEGLLYCKGQKLLSEDIFLYCDNEALVKHLNGKIPVRKTRALKFYKGEVKALADLFKSVHFKHIIRNKNREAHHLATVYQRMAVKRLYHDGWHNELASQVVTDAPQIGAVALDSAPIRL